MTKNCNRCQAEITWKTPYTKGDTPLNPDMSKHICQKATPQQITTNFESVKWEILAKDEFTADMEELMLGLKTMRSLAYQDAKDVHPDMAENSNTFGQIVNAGISHLINLAKVKALRVKAK